MTQSTPDRTNPQAPVRQPVHQYKSLKAADDGVVHLNVGAGAVTELGKLLNPMASACIRHPYLGPFRSHEGYRQFLLHAEPNDNLRYMFGTTRLQDRPGHPPARINRTYYKRLVIDGYYLKITQDPHLLALFLESTLPFEQYYFMNVSNLLVQHSTAPWHKEGLERIRTCLQHDQPYELVNHDDYLKITPRSPAPRSAG